MRVPLGCKLPAMSELADDKPMVVAPGTTFICPVCSTSWQLVHLAANGGLPQPHWMTTKVGV